MHRIIIVSVAFGLIGCLWVTRSLLRLISGCSSAILLRSPRKLLLAIHESVKVRTKLGLEAILHPLLKDQLEHLSCLAGVFAGDYVALCQRLHLPDGQVTEISDRRWHDHERALVTRHITTNVHEARLFVQVEYRAAPASIVVFVIIGACRK